MDRSPYSEYKLCVCSHLRLVCYTEGRPWTGISGKVYEAHGPGWYHISPDGTLNNFSEPCQASIHRFDFEWPEDCTSIPNLLRDNDLHEQTINEKYPER